MSANPRFRQKLNAYLVALALCAGVALFGGFNFNVDRPMIAYVAIAFVAWVCWDLALSYFFSEREEEAVTRLARKKHRAVAEGR